MTKKENISLFKGQKGKRKYHRYTEKEKATKLKESIPYIQQGMSLRSVAAMIKIPYNTYYLWIIKLKAGGKAALADYGTKAKAETADELSRAIEWMDKRGMLKYNKAGFTKAKRVLKLKRTALTLYVRHRENVRRKR